MEVLPCSGVQYVGEANGTEQVKMVGELPEVNMEGPQMRSQSAGNGIADELPLPEQHHSGASYSDCQMESQRLSGDCHDLEDDDISVQTYCIESCDTPVDTIESEPSRDAESVSEPKWLQKHDESVALWVKWRGKWQAGIRCARSDWPLSTLKAKPTHDRKKYFVIFFPHTRNYSWADMMLVRSIEEFPQPNACRTHKIGLKMVRDLNIGRRFIMKKLAVGMLNIVVQFHQEALVDTARDVTVWKEFAMEAARCSGYSDLGRMLLRLQNMISPRYINSDWLVNSFHSWAQRCQDAQSAESIELLKEELSDSIRWNEVNSLSNAPVQSTLGSEWKTWKHEVMKWFSASQTLSSSGDLEHESPSNTSLPVSRKRPKLEVRRGETSNLLQPMAPEIDSGFFSKVDDEFSERAAPLESPSRWDGIVVEAGNSEFPRTKDFETTPINEVVTKKALDPGSKNRQCIAFIESKGRNCVRWANDGDVYCCVHLTSRFIGTSSTKSVASPPVNSSPMCGGTTVLGTHCKHRSLPGSSFCKKHRPRTDSTNASNLSGNSLKRKLEEVIPGLETTYCKDMVLVGEVETPLQIEPLVVMDGDSFQKRNNLESCIGSSPVDSNFPCHETPKRYSLYCDKHIPSWLKRARNGKSRIIPKEVFAVLLKDCFSPDQKLCLHKACELFYKLFKSIMSLRNPVPMEVQLQWALSEASKDSRVGELLLKLVCTEKERLKEIWGFTAGENAHISSVVEKPKALPLVIYSSLGGDERSIKCRFCSEEFTDDQELGSHCMSSHRKESQWLFRGQACAICLDSFTNRKLLESHIKERHNSESVEQSMLLQCISCGSHFGNAEELWKHALEVHPVEFRMSKADQQHNIQKMESGNNPPSEETNSENFGGIRRFICRFCGLKFDLLPDLGRHHQAAHMGAHMLSSRPAKRGVRHFSYRLKSGRLSRPGFKKILGTATYKMQNRGNGNLKKRIQASKFGELTSQHPIPEPEALGRLAESECSSVANMLFSDIQKTKPRPNNLDILAAARAACCKVSLKASLEGKYGVLPERLYLKAAKLCSEHDITVQWHQDGFICPRGCKSFKDPGLLLPLVSRPNFSVSKPLENLSEKRNNEWEVDECHYVIDLKDFREIPKQKVTVLCNDISFGKEVVPIVCVVDEDLLTSLNVSPDVSNHPWESFTYTTKPFLDPSRNPDIENMQSGCACPHSLCIPERCDHVYLFDNDYEDAKDIHGKPMRGRFPYDDKGRLILEEGYLVYECNQMCSCSKTCPNRILQNGLRVKLEVFKTKNKGWAVRACEPILRGTFVCEYIGEVLDEQEANERRGRYGEQGCSYMYGIDARTNDMSRLIGEQEDFVIDATKYGNVSRFINHSCNPNLVHHQVLVNSMESEYAHIGLYASRDILSGEELTHNYRYDLIPGDGCPCLCGTSKCKGRLY
ncbi:Histone-lysine N-methyltransferase SUVR5 [Euphorbia peplus]|nr:Histone-lysine N-methyltransferase SUVR5 [Euphorbia peplus]